MRKTTTLLFLVLMLPFLSIAQISLESHEATGYISGDTTLKNAHVKIVNISANPISVKVAQDNSGATNGHVSYFCWGVSCYPPTVTVSTNANTIPAGDTNTTFIGYLEPAGHTGISVINYTFFNTADQNDFIDVAFTYDISIGIDELSNSVSLSNPSPNPANNLTSISYDLKSIKNGSFILYNVLGSKLNEFKLTERQETLIIPTSQLNSGIYFYSIVADGKLVTTKKLIVAHR